MRRRDFLLEALGLATLTTLAPAWRPAAGATPDAAGRRAPRLRFGYAAITWGGNDGQAIDDVSALGFAGIQLRASAVAKWVSAPAS